MIQRVHVENFLRLNGIPATAPDEDVRSALMTAKWNEHDVEVALMMLRGEKGSEDIEVVAARQLFTSDAPIAPEALTALLGVRVHLPPGTVETLYRKEMAPSFSPRVLLPALLLGALIALLTVLGAMYVFEMGPF